MNFLTIKVDNLYQVLKSYDEIRILRSNLADGTFTEITTIENRPKLDISTEYYYYTDSSGVDEHFYQSEYSNSVTGRVSSGGTIRRTDSTEERIGYTFDNYTPKEGEWGHVYTADDIRYSMLFGIETVASDTAETSLSDTQIDQAVQEATAEFEEYLSIDIFRRIYRTNPDPDLKRSRYWREGVQFTDLEETYPFIPEEWRNKGFIQLRHRPVIKMHRAIWYHPLKGVIMNMLDNKWLRLEPKKGQINQFPTTGVSYGPFLSFAAFAAHGLNVRYPQAFEFDYETGFLNSDYVPESLRSVIGKYAAIKILATVGDGLLAGFSSQSISLDGLSESFSSVQSPTSAFFGARIKQYTEEIKEYLKKNRYKYGTLDIAFI